MRTPGYLVGSRKVDAALRDLICGIDVSRLDQPDVPFRWLDVDGQTSPEALAVKGLTRMCWVEPRGIRNAQKAHTVGWYDESAILNISYAVDSKRGPAPVYLSLRADAFAIYNAINVRFSGTLVPINRLSAESSTITELRGMNGDNIASLIHQIPLQMQYFID